MLTIYQKFRETALNHPRNKSLFWKEKSKWYNMGYADLLKKVDLFSEILKSIGVKKDDKVAILSENRPEWVVSDLAINKIGAVSVPIHMVSGEDFIKYSLENSESTYFLLSSEAFERNKSFIFDFPDIKNYIIFGRVKSIVDDKRVSYFDDLFSEVNTGGSDRGSVSASFDLASIIYTSGTTGNPKGVMLTNKNFISNTFSAMDRIKVFPEDRFLSVLPLSHVLERTAGNFIPLFQGASIAYVKSKEDIMADLQKIKPSIIILVPKIFERIYENIFSKSRSGSKIKKDLFFWSIKQEKGSWSYLVADNIVFRKIRNIFGGNLRLSISGGASLSESIIKFFDRVGIRILEGYGLTETSPLVSVNGFENNAVRFGTVGRAVSGVEIKIADDKEILVRGDNVMSGYLKNNRATEEAISKDGWFKTGDLGFLDKDNFLTIIGRKKDIIVTSNGKNISPEKIENLLNLSPYIEQSLVVGHKKSFLSALIVVDVEKTKSDFDSITFDNEVFIKNLINKELDKINKKLPFYENIKKFIIMNEPFTEKNGELTSTLKLRRKIIESKYSRDIESLYEVKN